MSYDFLELLKLVHNRDLLHSRPRQAYVDTILRPSSWGGAIELAIFAKRYQVELCSIDVQTGRIDRFGDGDGYSSMGIVVYSGIRKGCVQVNDAE